MWEIVAEALPGLEELAAQEVGALTGAGRRLRFQYAGDLGALLGLRLVQSVYLVVAVRAARPTALLGDQHLRRLEQAIRAARGLHPRDAFRTFRLGAAGHSSSTFRRLAAALQERTALAYDQQEGDLLVRVRRSEEGWEALVRLSPRPLTARAWRVRDMPGALNAGIAAAMVRLTDPDPRDRFANLLCGSGTLLVERLLAAPAGQAVGFDVDREALEAARENLEAAGLSGRIDLVRADAGCLPCADGAFEALTADLPYGDLVGSHGDNRHLYPRMLREAARVAAPAARMVLVTQDIRLLEGCLAEVRQLWEPERRLRVFQGGHRPEVTVLRRLAGA